MRTFSKSNRELVKRRLVEVVEGIAAAHGLGVEASFGMGYPVTVNDPTEADFAGRTADELFGPGRYFVAPQPVMGSEDFSYVLEEVPGAFVFLGACPPDRDPATAAYNHSPEAQFDDAVLPDGAALYASLAHTRLARRCEPGRSTARPDGDRPLRMADRPVPVPGPARCWSGSRRAACAGPTCTWPKATCRRTVRDLRPATRWSGAWWRPGRERRGPRRRRLAAVDLWGLPLLPGRQENLCPSSTYTGWDADGGFAEYLTAPAAYVYPLPEDVPAERLAPLLCAGIVGYRALLRCDLPPGGRLGVYGFGASAHLTAQAAIALGAVVHVVTRSAAHRELALELGAASARDRPPEPLDAAILFAPVGELVPVALEALDRGGTLAVAGIHLTDIPSLNYDRHLFQERTLRSVTANTRADGRAYLDLVRAHPPVVRSVPYAFEDADQALTICPMTRSKALPFCTYADGTQRGKKRHLAGA